MVKIIITLLLVGLTIIRALQLVPDDILEKEKFYRNLESNSSAVGLSMEQYYHLMELRPFAIEFVEHFRNITANDLDFPDTRLPTLPALPTPQDLQCLADMSQLLNGISSKNLWALRMIDSWGTIPNGLLKGNIIDMGNYDECIGINEAIRNNYNLKGKFCFTKFPILKSLELPISIRIAVCFPASCSTKNMDMFLSQLIKKLINIDVSNKKLVSEASCKTTDREPLDGLTIFTIVLLSLLGAAVALATLCDYFLFDDQKPLPIVVKAFSLRANSRSLFRMVQPNSNPNVIDCLHGMRCMSLIWVLVGHQYAINIVSPNMNFAYLYWWFKNPFSNFIFHAVFSVDSFFFLSGLLLVMIALRSLEKTKGKLNVPLMYLHRYLRLTPIVAVAILFYIKLLPLLGDGPLAYSLRTENYAHCEHNWFWTLLYVQNYAVADFCLNHTWYLAVDMQLFIISPILLISLYKWGKKAAAGIFVFMLLLSACLFATIMTNKYTITMENGAIDQLGQRKLYYATHTHAAPWLIGVLFGYFLHLCGNKSFKLNRIVVWLGWLICLALMFTSLLATYPASQPDAVPLTLLEQALYYTLTRIAWPLSLCWVVFACKYGYGGMANSFLSSPLWQPLSKLSYAAYIFHPFIQNINAKRMRSSQYFSDYDVMQNFWAGFGFTIIMSYVMYILLEAPLGILESLLLPNRRPAPKPAVANTPQIEPKTELERSAATAPTSETDLKLVNRPEIENEMGSTRL